MSVSNTARIPRKAVYMEIAKTFSKRSTCRRKAVGAVIVRDNHILGTGYNGAPRAQDDCLSVGCLLDNNHCVRTVHAEVNAVLSAAYNGVSTKDAIMYSTAKPCFRCRGFLINAGILTVYYDEEYNDEYNNTEQTMMMVMKYEQPATK